MDLKVGGGFRFVLRNAGTEDHEFLLATTRENLKHAEVMKKKALVKLRNQAAKLGASVQVAGGVIGTMLAHAMFALPLVQTAYVVRPALPFDIECQCPSAR